MPTARRALLARHVRREVRQHRPDLLIRDRERWRRCQLERLVRPRQTGQLEQQPDLALVRALEHRRLGIEAEDPRRPPEVGLQDLPDVHAARHAERVEHDVDRPTVREERHVLLGNDSGHDALVPVTARHLVADRDLALLGQIDLHELNHARRQLIGLENPVDPLLRLLLDARLLFVRRIDDRRARARSTALFSTRNVLRSSVATS